MNPSPATPAPPEDATDQNMQRVRIRQAGEKLTPDQRQVIVLKFWQDWENEEIARLLGKPVGAVKSIQHRALSALQKHLQE
ncbi:MAG: sigma-70 family RNA polymerase sigma factor [Anaerolineales bacterium]|nr:sigma-70 family RNA polymerase sigma factor [Anaerolineales bacterium]MDX9937532.1 sigma-70 family RNA polymerase sigma factor [Anaerolineales bacterium]WKZ50872.1 MAG: sigma-70 family RNA polymerase sigma factor [Anaerolineales bacterium]